VDDATGTQIDSKWMIRIADDAYHPQFKDTTILGRLPNFFLNDGEPSGADLGPNGVDYG